MKNSTSPNDAQGLAVNLERLCALKPDELAERWRSLFGSDPPARLRRPRFRRLPIAFRKRRLVV